MNSAIELHDSDIENITAKGRELHLHFSAAYVHQSTGRPGIDSGAGYIQPVELTLFDASWTDLTLLCAGPISDGELIADDQSFSLIPLPFSASGKISVELVFTSGAIFSASASSVSCTSAGEPRFVEYFTGGG